MIKATVDTSKFEAAFARYMEHSSKTLVDALNWKLYDASREAIKGTAKAVPATIRSKLNEVSRSSPKMTVAEMLVVTRMRAKKQEVYNLEEETKQLIKGSTAHIGFVRAGWLPAIKKLIKYVGRESVSIGGLTQMAFGGATPAVKVGSTIRGDSYNDTAGTGNKAFVQSIKEKGAQQGIDKATADIEKYLLKKMGIPADEFNKS